MAKEAPEKIYIVPLPSGSFDREFFINTIYGDEIEYTRTDAFMKKAKEAFCKATCNGCPQRSTCTSLGTCREYDNFVKFLKEE